MENWAPTTVAFSPDGRLALLDSRDTQLWDAETGKKIHRLPAQALAAKFGNAVNDAAFSPDGRHFVIAGAGMELYDVFSGRLVTKFRGRTHGVQSAAFSPDSRFLMTSYQDGALILWNVASGGEIRLFAQQTGPARKIVYSPTGRFVLSANTDGTLTLWGAASGRWVRSFSGRSQKVRAAVFSPDGRYCLSGTDTGLLTVWEVASGRGVKIVKGHAKAVSALAFSSDGRHALSGGDDATLKLWDYRTGELIRTFVGHTDAITSLSLSPDGRYAVSASKDTSCRLWDISGGNEVRIFRGHSHWVNDVAFSLDGRFLLSGGSDQKVKLWEVATGREIRSMENGKGWVYCVAFTPDGRRALSGSWRDLTLWDLATGKDIRTFEGHSGNVTSVAFSPDGSRFVSGSDDDRLTLWYTSTALAIRTFKGHLDDVHAVDFDSIGRHVLSASDDMTARIWEADSGREIVRLVASSDGEWLVVTPDGYYNNSPEGAGLLHWVSAGGMESFTYEQFESRFRRPAILERRLSGDRSAGMPAPEITRPPLLEMKDHLGIRKTDGRSYPVTLDASALQALRSIRIFNNGKPAKEVLVDARTARLSQDISLVAGANRITAVAYDDNGFSSNPKYLDVTCSNRELFRPDLHVVCVGVSDYPNLPMGWNLEFCHTDAKALKTVLEGQTGKMFRNVQTVLALNSEATVGAVTRALSGLQAIGEDDVAVIFLAGHGVRDENGTFYFLTTNGALDDLEKGGISWHLLRDALAGVKGRVVLFLDACHSGSITAETVVPNDELARTFFSGEQSGVMVFSASKGRQYSLESPDIGGGFGIFTYALVQGLGSKSDQADRNRNGFVEFLELVDYVSRYVDRRTRGEQTPWLSRKELFGDLPIAAVQ
jgi:WD40 repeat protein